jgi:hypothetical protein
MGLAAAASAPARVFLKIPSHSIPNAATKHCSADAAQIIAPIVMLCGNAYLGDVGLPQMTGEAGAGHLVRSATKPLSENLVDSFCPPAQLSPIATRR